MISSTSATPWSGELLVLRPGHSLCKVGSVQYKGQCCIVTRPWWDQRSSHYWILHRYDTSFSPVFDASHKAPCLQRPQFGFRLPTKLDEVICLFELHEFAELFTQLTSGPNHKPVNAFTIFTSYFFDPNFRSAPPSLSSSFKKILGATAKLRKASVRFVISVFLASHWKDFQVISCLVIFG